MKKIVPFFILFFVTVLVSSNTRAQTEYNGETLFTVVEKMPEYPGGEIALRKFLRDNIMYPLSAKVQGIEGRVYVRFYVTKTGELVETKIIRSPNEDMSAEVLRVIKLMPKWIPGTQAGRRVHVIYNLPIDFLLN